LTITLKLVKGLIVYLAYMILRFTPLYSHLIANPLLKSLELTYVIPFRYLFVARFGEAYTIESAFSKKYYEFLPVHPGSTVIDIGAHIGTYTLRASRKVGKRGFVIAVKPEPTNVEYLTINCILAKCKNVKILKIALSKKGYARLYLHDFTGHSMYIPSRKSILVKVISLDTLTSMLGRPNNSGYLIKMNAGGSELEILQGSTKTLKRCEALVIATHHSPQQAYDISKFLREQGFTTKVVDLKGNKLLIAKRY
jgi:FkbM family methyltransferase